MEAWIRASGCFAQLVEHPITLAKLQLYNRTKMSEPHGLRFRVQSQRSFFQTSEGAPKSGLNSQGHVLDLAGHHTFSSNHAVTAQT